VTLWPQNDARHGSDDFNLDNHLDGGSWPWPKDLKFQLVCRFKYVKNVGTITLRVGPAKGAVVHGIIIAAMLTLVGDNGSADQVPAPSQC
jgi:hypothetical protein